jgi:hypothetical protein
MNYSYYHKAFANSLNYLHNINTQDVLEHPENYLGPNYKEVLNFWFYKDSLSEEQCNVYSKRYWALDSQTYTEARELAKKLAVEVIDSRFVEHFWEEECEIIAAHLYLERDTSFTFIPLIFDL